MKRKPIISRLTTLKTFYGFPIAWFEPCDTLIAEGWIYKGQICIDGIGNSQPIRMKNEFRERAGWQYDHNY